MFVHVSCFMEFAFFPNKFTSDAGVFYSFQILLRFCFFPDGIFRRNVEISNNREFSFRFFTLGSVPSDECLRVPTLVCVSINTVSLSSPILQVNQFQWKCCVICFVVESWTFFS